MNGSSDCGDCGHSLAEHNDAGYCMHYEHGACICCAYVRQEDATPEMRARRLFGRQHHSVYSFKLPFSTGGQCQREGCPREKTRRIMVNIWGSVCEYDACEECGQEFHGKLLDEFPARRPERAAHPQRIPPVSHPYPSPTGCASAGSV